MLNGNVALRMDNREASEKDTGARKWCKFLKVIVASIGALSMTACATAVRGTHTEFSVATEPPGATVTTDLVTDASKREILRLKRTKEYNEETFEPEYYSCSATPCSFNVSRRSEFVVTVDLDGYHPAKVHVTSGFGSDGRAASATGAIAVASGAYLVTVASYTSLYATLYGVTTALTYGLASYSAGASAGAAYVALSGAATGLLFGGLLIGIDVASGAMLDLSPNPVILVLVPEDQPFPTDTNEIIDSEERLQEVLQENGVVLEIQPEESPAADGEPVEVTVDTQSAAEPDDGRVDLFERSDDVTSSF